MKEEEEEERPARPSGLFLLLLLCLRRRGWSLVDGISENSSHLPVWGGEKITTVDQGDSPARVRHQSRARACAEWQIKLKRREGAGRSYKSPLAVPYTAFYG